jgi:hypothetical protein
MPDLREVISRSVEMVPSRVAWRSLPWSAGILPTTGRNLGHIFPRKGRSKRHAFPACRRNPKAITLPLLALSQFTRATEENRIIFVDGHNMA